MKKRLIIYLSLAIPLAVFTWYSVSIGTEALAAVWVMIALAITVYEIKQSGKPLKSAFAVTSFWLAAITAYTLFWAGIVFLGYGGEQLTYLQIGMSPDWLIQDLQFYQHTMLPYLTKSYGLLALGVGPLLGGGAGWLLIRSGLLQHSTLQKKQQ